MEKIKKFLMSGGSQAMNVPEQAARALNDLFARQSLTSGAIAIQGAANPGAKTTAAVTAVIEGSLYQAAAANLPALTGYNLTANQYGYVLFGLDASGAFSVYFGTPSATLAGVQLPTFPERNAATGEPQVAIGALILANGGSAFTGGTTALDSITTTYINFVGPLVPTNRF
ncbi:MAG: hypothetical protein JO142_10450 [Burkholderiales bacterium]|nr:hypothetical protein [Burkholderiales bacterium]